MQDLTEEYDLDGLEPLQSINTDENDLEDFEDFRKFYRVPDIITEDGDPSELNFGEWD